MNKPDPSRVLDEADSFCPRCGHDRDRSSVSSIDHGNGVKSCQMCHAMWREGPDPSPKGEPELPEPYGWLHDASGNDPLTFARKLPPMMALTCSTMPVYAPAQLSAFYAAGVRAGMERAAGMIEEVDTLAAAAIRDATPPGKRARG